MWNILKGRLAPPVFEDEDKTRTANLLNIIVLALLLVLSAMGMAFLFLFPGFDIRAVSVFSSVLIFLGVYALMRWGYIKLASIIFVLSLWGAITTTIVVSDGSIRSPGLSFYFISTLIAGLLLGLRFGGIIAVLSIVAGLGLVYAETKGFTVDVTANIPIPGVLTVHAFALMMMVVLLYLYTRQLNQALERSRRNERDLAESNRELQAIRGTLEERIAIRTQGLETVATLSERLTGILDLEQLLIELVNRVKEGFDYYHVHIYILDDQRQNLVMTAGVGRAGAEMKAKGHSIPMAAPTSLVARAARTGQIVKIDNVREAEDWLPNPLLPNTHSEMAVPIIREEKVVGTLDVQDEQIGGLDEGDANLLRSLAGHVAVAMTNAQMFEQAQQRAVELNEAKEVAERASQEAEAANQTMEVQMWQTAGQAQLSDKMRGGPDVSTLAGSVIGQLCQYLQVQVGRLYVMEEEVLRLRGGYAYAKPENPANQFNIGDGLVGQAAAEKRTIIIDNIPEDSLTLSCGLGEIVPKHVLASPFMYESDVFGVVEMGALNEFTPEQLKFLEVAVESIAIAFNTAQARTRVDELLAETQQQAEELQVQSEELRVANEELETQTNSLRESEGRLKENQTELETANAELEERASILHEQQAVLDRQNRDLKTAQQELQQKAEELALASKYKSEFLANMSHELRTPLNSLLILAGMLVKNEAGNLTEDQVESIKIIYGGGNDLLNLINEIMDLSKIEAGKMEFYFDPVSLADLVRTMELQFTHVAKEKGLAFKITLADDLPASIETDQKRVEQIIKNLLSNAFKFTEAGSVSLGIYRPEGFSKPFGSELNPAQTIAVSITDTGLGMTPKQQKIVFEAFQQAEGGTSRKYGGTGLGLSISRELATRLGGYIDLESEPDRGSVFTLYLPVEGKGAGEQGSGWREGAMTKMLPRSPAPPLPRPPAPQPIPDDRDDLSDGDKTLLIIEDDPKFAKIVCDFSRQKEFKCLVAGDGRTGLKLVETYKPDAIILDLHLPGISGWEVLDMLKHDPATRHIPVHIMSIDDETLDAYKKGAIGFLTKPISPENLEATFEKIEGFIAREIKSLLLVEDDVTLRQSVKKLLGSSDVKISEAGGGETALKLLRSQHFDCMILDLKLPDMSGFEVLNTMHQDETVPKCPVIVYTGQDLSQEENLQLMKYADSVIVKGVKSPERLLDETALFLHQVVADMPKEKQQTIRQLHDPEAMLAGKKILIVDDDMRNSYALSKLLRDKGMKVKIAADGQKALDLLAEDPAIDLVLMDVMMPVMDGYEATRHIRAQSQFKRLPILALTAKAMRGDREKCLEAGANDYLPKPVDSDRLFSMLRVWLYR